MALAFRADDKGILPDRMIAALAEGGGIIAAAEFNDDQIQPASLDLRLGEGAFRVRARFLPGPRATAAARHPPAQGEPGGLDLRLGEVAFRVRASFLPGPGATVAERIDDLKLHEITLGDGSVLETGCVYIVPLQESMALPADIAAAATPKSSAGRLDVFTRVIADQPRGFDRVEAGYHGPLYAEISPRTFPVLVREGSRLSQIRFRRGRSVLGADALCELHAHERLVDDEDADVSDGVSVGVDLAGFDGL